MCGVLVLQIHSPHKEPPVRRECPSRWNQVPEKRFTWPLHFSAFPPTPQVRPSGSGPFSLSLPGSRFSAFLPPASPSAPPALGRYGATSRAPIPDPLRTRLSPIGLPLPRSRVLLQGLGPSLRPGHQETAVSFYHSNLGNLTLEEWVWRLIGQDLNYIPHRQIGAPAD